MSKTGNNKLTFLVIFKLTFLVKIILTILPNGETEKVNGWEYELYGMKKYMRDGSFASFFIPASSCVVRR